jgi:hypothetical protein
LLCIKHVDLSTISHQLFHTSFVMLFLLLFIRALYFFA